MALQRAIASGGLLEQAAEVIYEIEHLCTVDPAYCQRRHSLLQVAGALERQLVKTTGRDFVGDITDETVRLAFLNEMARVVRGWPETLDFLRPAPFATASHELRTALFSRGLCNEPGELWPSNWRYRYLNFLLPMIVTNLDRRVMFCSPEAMDRFANIPEYATKKLTTPSQPYGVYIHPDDRDLICEDRSKMLRGLPWVNCEYRTIWSNPNTVQVWVGDVLNDDENAYLGDVLVFDLVQSEKHIEYEQTTVHGQPVKNSLVHASSTRRPSSRTRTRN